MVHVSCEGERNIAFESKTLPHLIKTKMFYLREKMLLNKYFSKYIHVGFCFEGFYIRNTMVTSEFNFDACLTTIAF